MNLKSLFYPKTLAVVGVSLNHEKHPANVIYHKNNLRLQAKAFAVNGRGGVYLGEKVYASVLSQKKLYTFCHSGLDPESSVFDLDSRFRGNDDFHHHCKEVLETPHQCLRYS